MDALVDVARCTVIAACDVVVEEFCLQQAVAHGAVLQGVVGIVVRCPYGEALVGIERLVVMHFLQKFGKVAQLISAADLLPEGSVGTRKVVAVDIIMVIPVAAALETQGYSCCH